MTVRAIPEGYHSITPYLVMHDATAAIEFYKTAFGATELLRMEAPGGKIGHCEMKFGDSPIMFADEHPEVGALSPKSVGGTPVSLMLYVDDVDTVFKRALDAGATELRAVQNQFYGDRSGMLKDPFDHIWTIATHVEDLDPGQMERRMEKMHG